MRLDAFLVKFGQAPARLDDALRDAARATHLDCASITTHTALAGTGIYAYAWLAAPASEMNDRLARYMRALHRDIRLSSVEDAVLPLQLLLDMPGA